MILAALILGTIGHFCDQNSVACPCPPAGVPTGCSWSDTGNGAWLNTIPINGWQTASVSNDTLKFFCSSLPFGTTAIVCQGTASGAVPFGDGVRCTSGALMRLATLTATGDIAIYPDVGQAPVSTRGVVPPTGGYRSYQFMFRAPAAFCTPATFNASNAIGVAWQP